MIFFGQQFSGFKCVRSRRHISSNIVKYRQIPSNIVRLKYQKFFITIVKYRRSLKRIKLKIKTKHLSTKAICTCLYHTCLYLYWLYLKLELTVFCGLTSNFIPTNIQNVGILRDIDQKN